jgi:predicted nucleotidyltransferase
VIEKYNPLCIILFGSLARTDYSERSDVDLIIIANSFPENVDARSKALFLLNPTFAPIEPIGFLPSEFEKMIEKRNCTAIFAMEEGIPLFGELYFNDLKQKYLQIKKNYKLEKSGSAWICKK